MDEIVSNYTPANLNINYLDKTLLLYYPKSFCSHCDKYLFDNLKKLLDIKQLQNLIVILPRENYRDFKVFSVSEDLGIEYIFSHNKDILGLPEDFNNGIFLVLDTNKKIVNSFIPNSSNLHIFKVFLDHTLNEEN